MGNLVERVKPLVVEAAKAAVTAGVAYLAAHWSTVNLPDDVKALVALVVVALWNRFVVKKAA
jgi:hypothetical protein